LSKHREELARIDAYILLVNIIVFVYPLKEKYKSSSSEEEGNVAAKYKQQK